MIPHELITTLLFISKTLKIITSIYIQNKKATPSRESYIAVHVSTSRGQSKFTRMICFGANEGASPIRQAFRLFMAAYMGEDSGVGICFVFFHMLMCNQWQGDPHLPKVIQILQKYKKDEVWRVDKRRKSKENGRQSSVIQQKSGFSTMGIAMK